MGERWTLHDIRRTVATRLHAAGVDVLTVEDLLGHSSGVRLGVAGVYNRAETLERQRPALRQWAIKLAMLRRELKAACQRLQFVYFSGLRAPGAPMRAVSLAGRPTRFRSSA